MHKASADNQATPATDIKLLGLDIDVTIAVESNNLSQKLLAPSLRLKQR